MAQSLSHTCALLEQLGSRNSTISMALETDLNEMIEIVERQMLGLTSTTDLVLNYAKLQAERHVLINMLHAIVNLNK